MPADTQTRHSTPASHARQSALEADLQAQTEALLRADDQRMDCLRAARELALPDWALGAGFIRNLIWDHLHHKSVPTALNDIDLIYLDSADLTGLQEAEHEAWLAARVPGQQWEVRNQARMHVRQLVPPSPARSRPSATGWRCPPASGAGCWQTIHSSGWPLRLCPQLVPAGGSQPALPPGAPGLYRAGQGQGWQRLWPDLVVNWP